MGKDKANRLVKNEAIFREINEDIQQWERNDGKDGRTHGSTSVAFYCECSDPHCKEKITITPALYEDIHNHRKQFILKPKHNKPHVENVVEEYSDFIVVEKIQEPPENPRGSLRIV